MRLVQRGKPTLTRGQGGESLVEGLFSCSSMRPTRQLWFAFREEMRHEKHVFKYKNGLCTPRNPTWAGSSSLIYAGGQTPARGMRVLYTCSRRCMIEENCQQHSKSYGSPFTQSERIRTIEYRLAQMFAESHIPVINCGHMMFHHMSLCRIIYMGPVSTNNG